MKHISAKIFSFVAATFLATSAFAWTPTVEVERTQAGVVQLKAGGWTTQAEMNEMNWASYRVWMLLNGQEYDVTAAVVSLFTSGHPSVSFTLNGHFDLSIALLQYFGIDPLLYPIGMEVCKQAAFGGECADSRESLVKRKPTDFTANATCYPDPNCATASGGFTTFPRVTSIQTGLLGHSFGGIEVTLDKATVVTGFRGVVTNGSPLGTPNSYSSGNVFLNIYSTLQSFLTSGTTGNIVDHATGQVTHAAFGAHPVGPLWTTDILTLRLATPISLQPGNYVFAPFSALPSAGTAMGGTQAIEILCTTTGLGTDYLLDGVNSQIVALSSVGGSFAVRPTLAVDILGY